MSFSYDPTRLDIPRNQLRLLLGNEGTSLKTFQDEELEYILQKNKLKFLFLNSKFSSK